MWLLRVGRPSEAYANVTIAYRHLEDASMRLGKAIQALEFGGISCWSDKGRWSGAAAMFSACG